MDKIKSLFHSRRFWTATAGVVLVVLQEAGLTDLDAETVQYVVLTLAAWIVGDSLRETE